MIEINDVLVLGTNGTTGTGSGKVFAVGGRDAVFLASSVEQAHARKTPPSSRVVAPVAAPHDKPVESP